MTIEMPPPLSCTMTMMMIFGAETRKKELKIKAASCFSLGFWKTRV